MLFGRRTMMGTRTEQDAFGEMTLPASALYGIQTARAVQNLSFSGRTLGQYPGFVRALAVVKTAAARANRVADRLDAQCGAAIEHAGAALLRGRHLDQFPVDPLGGGGWIGVNANINEVLANLANVECGAALGDYAPVHPTRHVNASQSTADVCHSAIRLALLEQWEDLQQAGAACHVALVQKAAELQSVPTLSRTCLQDALPVSLGSWFGAAAAAIARRLQESERAVQVLRYINLGGTVIGSGDGAPQAYRQAVPAILAELSGRDLRLRPDLYDAAQNIDDLAATSSQLALLAEVLMKIAQDLRLLSSGPQGGLGEIILPATQAGSSFFGGKINPVIPETLLQCCFQVLGCDRAVHAALERGELNLNVFESAAGINLLEAMQMLGRALQSFVERCVKGIIADEGRCRALAALARSGPRS
jgi:aspartate ammonia-lyase